MPFLKATFCLNILLFASITQAQNLLDRQLAIPPGSYTLEEALEIIKENGISVAYSVDKLPETNWINLLERSPLQSYLNDLANKTHIKFRVLGDLLVISYDPFQSTNHRVSIRGFLRDAETGEVLIGATVNKTGTDKGTVTNRYGYYSITLRPGVHIIKASFLGYHSLQDTIVVERNNKMVNFRLHPKTEQLDEVMISAIEPDENITSLIPSKNTINLNTRGQIPYFLGEVDVLQGATFLPGISTLGEDANGLNIRGGSVDQNLILLDEATIYNPNHVFGLISIFNPEAVNSIEIMKGFIPPSYGGRSSSVITVHQKEGNDQHYSFTGGIGLLSARMIAEGPIVREKSSFIASARQSLINLTLDDNNTTSRFNDLNLKVNWKANNKNTFYLSAYYGNDKNENAFNRVSRWGNRNISARWNRLYGPRIFGHFSAIVSEYNYRISQPQEAASYIGQSRIIDYTLKSDWGWTISPDHEIEFGGSVIFHHLKPGDRIPFEEGFSSSNPLFLDNERGLESAIYMSHQAKFGKKFSALYGARLSALHNIGPRKVYTYDKQKPKTDATITDSINYQRGELINATYGLEPRISLVFQLSDQRSIKTSYSRTFQYLHLISNTISPTPTDIWKLSDTHIPPTMSDHFSTGYYQNFNNNKWEAYIEAYYKWQNNLLEYKNGADLLYNENPETELLTGTGRSYGIEFFLKKNRGLFTGWLSYTLSKSEVKVDGNFTEERINDGQYFPANHDKLHDVSLVGIYEILPRLSGSFSFKYNSGAPFTLPIGKYEFEDIIVPDFRHRNQSRLPDYHRLDLSLKWRGKTVRKNGEPRRVKDYWTLAIYNVYGRNNVYSYFFEVNPETNTTEIIPNTIFENIIPAITYHFKF